MSSFFPMLFRMQYIQRWGLMHNLCPESLSEHSLNTAILAHALAVIGKERLGREVRPEEVALFAIFHDCTEIITGDLPTPVKYHNQRINTAYKEIEKAAARTLSGMLPQDLAATYEPLLLEETDPHTHALVKAADKLSAYIKCLEEEKAGNTEFSAARKTILAALEENPLPELGIFMEEFLPAFSRTLDELTIGQVGEEGAPHDR
ncbi:MAG: 5'-deoxynucleotidase [Oscillospiraceae bacterium]|nr:5'-deoxynucleotidase [Oscillospiraceae bacterium]